MRKKTDKKPAYFPTCHEPTEKKEFWAMQGKAIPLYFFLCKMRNRHTNGKTRSFWQTDTQITKATGWDERTIKNARRELMNRDFIGVVIGHGKRATQYTILDEITYLE